MFFVNELPNLATLTIKIFNYFIKKTISLHLNMLNYFETYNNWITECKFEFWQ